MNSVPRVRAWALAWIVLGLTACSSSAAAPGSPTPGITPVVILVRNDNIRDMEIFLDRDGRRTRLGVVIGKDDTSIRLDRAQFPGQGRLRFALVPFGVGSAMLTRPVVVRPGETVVVTIGVELGFTRVEIRR